MTGRCRPRCVHYRLRRRSLISLPHTRVPIPKRCNATSSTSQRNSVPFPRHLPERWAGIVRSRQAVTMSKLNATDIQGFVLRGYNLPVARYLFLRLEDAQRERTLVSRLLNQITTGQRWDGGKPQSTLNIGFTFSGLQQLELPLATLITFPVEFQQGMRHRAELLGDTG